MPPTTITIHFDGTIPLDTFADAIQRFGRLVNALTQEVGGRAGIDWIVDDLTAGSATATIRGEAEDIIAVERVVSAYSVVGRAMERNDAIPYSERVVSAARGLVSIVDDDIRAINFITDSESSLITTGVRDQSGAYLSAFGSVEGRVETLRSRGRLSFTLYDSLDDRAVSCFLKPEQTEAIREAWGKRAVVGGWIKREPAHGRPVEINPVESIRILPEVVPGSYRRARGVLPADPEAPAPEVVIRRLRDAR